MPSVYEDILNELRTLKRTVTYLACCVSGGTIDTLNNGLTLTGTNGQLGGPLVHDTSINTGLFSLTATGSAQKTVEIDNTSLSGVNVALNIASSGDGINVISSGNGASGAAIFGQSDALAGAGLYGFATNSNSSGAIGAAFSNSDSVGILGVTDIGVAGKFLVTAPSNNTVVTNIKVQRGTSTLPVGVGMGESIDYILQDVANNNTVASRFITKWVDPTADSGQVEIWNDNAGTLQQHITDLFTGQLQLNNYTSSSSFPGTPVGALGFDASGHILTTSAGGSFTNQYITSGSTATGSGSPLIATINPATTLAALTFTMPPAPANNDLVIIRAGGTITTGFVVSTFAVSPNGGQTILDTNPPAFLFASDSYKLRWDSSLSTWYAEK